MSWSFFKCDRCAHPAERYSLLQWQVTEMFKRASKPAVTGEWFMEVRRIWTPHAELEKCKDPSVHIYPVTNQFEVPLHRLLLPTFQHREICSEQTFFISQQFQNGSVRWRNYFFSQNYSDLRNQKRHTLTLDCYYVLLITQEGDQLSIGTINTLRWVGWINWLWMHRCFSFRATLWFAAVFTVRRNNGGARQTEKPVNV